MSSGRSRIIRENDSLFNDKIDYDNSSAKAYPFLVHKGKLYVGDVSKRHSQLMGNLTGSEDNDDYNLDGRLWTKHKIVTFWQYPNDLKSFLNKLSAEAKKQQGISINWDQWKIEVTDPKTKKRIYIKIPDYFANQNAFVKKGKSIELKHMKSPMQKQRDPVPSGVGSKKSYGSRFAAQNRALVPWAESLIKGSLKQLIG